MRRAFNKNLLIYTPAPLPPAHLQKQIQNTPKAEWKQLLYINFTESKLAFINNTVKQKDDESRNSTGQHTTGKPEAYRYESSNDN